MAKPTEDSRTANPGPAPSRRAFEAWRNRNVSLLETAMGKALDKLAQGQPPAVERLVEAMGYSLMGGGKRLRPLLALGAAEAVGGKATAALPAAVAVEMIHAYSLIHDDLPAMDDDDLRRGRPTNHKVFGEGPAILAGDGLLTLAFELILGGAHSESELARRARAALMLARSAGALGMVGGQALDLSFEDRRQPGEAPEIDGRMVSEMETRKTGELMAAALQGGAILVGVDNRRLKSLRALGLELGLAFQIQDDLLDLHGDCALLGKTVGADIEKGKATFPAVVGEEAAARALEELTAKCLDRVAAFGAPGRNLFSLIESLINRSF